MAGSGRQPRVGLTTESATEARRAASQHERLRAVGVPAGETPAMGRAGVYVSIPFCAQKCTYCNFRSAVFPAGLRSEYVRLLAREIRGADLRQAGTLYFGGGSPSLLEPAEFSAVAAGLRCNEWDEATIEIAPGEATHGRVRAWASAGIDRVSFGVQSFVPAVARLAGRRHDARTVRAEIGRLAAAGIRNISVDLIAGLAHQSQTTWRESLGWVERLEVDHVSVYMLEKDDDSRLGRELRSGGTRYGAADVPGDDEILDLYLFAVERLRALGYERYEISNFARPGRRSLHNLKYWRMTPYFGFGSDAHSFSGSRRWANVPTATEYVSRMSAGRSPRDTCESLSARRILEDRVLTGLRTPEGIRLEREEWQSLYPNAERLVDLGWLATDRSRFRLTDEGLLFADQAIFELLG